MQLGDQGGVTHKPGTSGCTPDIQGLEPGWDFLSPRGLSSFSGLAQALLQGGWILRKQRWKLQGIVKPRLGNSHNVTFTHAVGQSKSEGHPRVKGLEEQIPHFDGRSGMPSHALAG